MNDKDPFSFPKDTYNPNEMDLGREERKEIEKRNKRRAIRDAADLKKVLDLVEGRRVLAKILYKACVFNEFGDIIESSFNSNSMSMAFTEGSRRLGFVLMNDIKRASPNSLIS